MTTDTETLTLCDNCRKPVRESGTAECAVRRWVHVKRDTIGCVANKGRTQTRYTDNRIAMVNGSPLVPA